MQAGSGVERKYAYFERIIYEGTGATCVVPDPSFNNALKAVHERLLLFKDKETGVWRRPIEPRTRKIKKHMKYAERELVKRIGRNKTEPYPSTYEVAISRDPAKRPMYLNAHWIFVIRGLLYGDRHTHAFIKYEKLLIYLKRLWDKDWIPRIINPRSIFFHLCWGRFICPLEHKIYRALDDWGLDIGNIDRVVMKGINAVEMGESFYKDWSNFIDPVWIGGDADRWDQHNSAYILRFEVAIYRLCLKLSKEDAELFDDLKKAMTDYLIIIDLPDGGLTVRMKRGRCSGDMNTSCGNIMICSMICIMYLVVNKIKAALKNAGDDTGFICERKDIPKFKGLPQWFKNFGFEFTLDPIVDDINKIRFCQASPIWTKRGYTMVRIHELALAKDFVFLQRLDTQKKWRKHMASLGLGGLALASGVPVFQELYCAFVRSACGVKPGKRREDFDGFYRMSKGLDSVVSKIESRTRYEYWNAFGVTPEEQLLHEKHFANCFYDWTPAIQRSSPLLHDENHLVTGPYTHCSEWNFYDSGSNHVCDEYIRPFDHRKSGV